MSVVFLLLTLFCHLFNSGLTGVCTIKFEFSSLIFNSVQQAHVKPTISHSNRFILVKMQPTNMYNTKKKHCNIMYIVTLK